MATSFWSGRATLLDAASSVGCAQDAGLTPPAPASGNIWPSLVESDGNGVVVGMNIDGTPMSRICAETTSSWDTGPVSAINVRSQLLGVLRLMRFCVCSSLLPVSMSPPK